MPRFVLLYHECPPHFPRPSHWDLMLERGEVLRTWALAQLPDGWDQVLNTSGCGPAVPAMNEVPAESLGDHRRDYLELEGPLSGDRGNVRRVEHGTYETLSETPDRLEVSLSGTTIRGRATLTPPATAGGHWSFAWRSE